MGQSCNVEGDEISGGSNIVYRIVFSDGTRWAFRVPYVSTSIALLVDTMSQVRNTVPDLAIAGVHGWSESEDGDGVGTPYILLDWIEGSRLHWSSIFPPPVAKEKILAQLAKCTVDLLTRTALQSSTQSTLKWMLLKIDRRLVRIFTGDLSSFDPIDCLIYRAMAQEKYHLPSLDTIPFPLMHTDLNATNILVGDDFNITAILDWDDLWACRLPLQFAVRCPAMITLENDPRYEELFRRDRLAFAEYFTSAIGSSDHFGDIGVHLPSILADEELQIFQFSIGSKGMYANWVTKYCVRSPRWVKAAMRALEIFVLSRPEMASLPEIVSVRCRLREMVDEFGQ